jgi:hypothetical protein
VMVATLAAPAPMPTAASDAQLTGCRRHRGRLWLRSGTGCWRACR